MPTTLTTDASTTDRRPTEAVGRQVQRNPVLVAIGRAGWVAKGIVYAVLGYLCFRIAVGGAGSSSGGDQEASQSGAVREIAESPGGSLLLWALAAGLLLYALWRLISVFLPAEGEGASVWLARAGYLLSTVIYSVLAWTAISFAMHDSGGGNGGGGSGGSQNAQVESVTRTVMENSLGRIAVGAAGLVVAAIGIAFVVRGVQEKFERQLDGRPVGPISHDALVQLGRVGWVARGLVMGLVALFVVRAAVLFDPDEAEGLDGALRRAADSTVGQWLVVVSGLGLIVYGVFCVLSAPRRRLAGPS